MSIIVETVTGRHGTEQSLGIYRKFKSISTRHRELPGTFEIRKPIYSDTPPPSRPPEMLNANECSLGI